MVERINQADELAYALVNRDLMMLLNALNLPLTSDEKRARLIILKKLSAENYMLDSLNEEALIAFSELLSSEGFQ